VEYAPGASQRERGQRWYRVAHSTGPGGQCTGELAGGVTHLGLSLAHRGHWAVHIRQLMRCRGGEGGRREERMVRLSVLESQHITWRRSSNRLEEKILSPTITSVTPAFRLVTVKSRQTPANLQSS